MENQFSTGRCIWDKACKQTLESISKAFSDEQNTDKATSIDVKATFSAIAKKIQEFPIPEYPFPLPETDYVTIIGKGTTSATTNKIVIKNSAHNTIAEISINDDGSGLNVVGEIDKFPWSDDDMITFAEWYHIWRGSPGVGTSGYGALKNFKEIKKQPPFNFIPIEFINRSALEKGRDYFVVVESGHIIQAHYTMITETEGDFFGKDTNEFVKVIKIDLNQKAKPFGKPC